MSTLVQSSYTPFEGSNSAATQYIAQGNGNNYTGGLANPPAAGNTIIILVNSEDQSNVIGPPVSIIDDDGNAFTWVCGQAASVGMYSNTYDPAGGWNGVSNLRGDIYYRHVSVGGSVGATAFTITKNYTAFEEFALCAMEFTGAFNPRAGSGGGGAATAWGSSSVTATSGSGIVAGDLVVGCFGDLDSSLLDYTGVTVPGAPFNSVWLEQRNSTYMVEGFGWYDATAGGVQTLTWGGFPGTTQQNFALMASFSAGPSMPVINTQPECVTSAVGGTPVLSVSDSNATSHQWQSAPITSLLSNVPGTWADIVGATSASYTTPTVSLADNGKWFRVNCTSGAGTVTSQPARLFVKDIGSTGGNNVAGDFGLTGYAERYRANSRGGRNPGMLLRKSGLVKDNAFAKMAIWTDWVWAPIMLALGITETGSAADTASSSVGGGGISVSVSEAGSAADTSTAAMSAARSVGESGAAADSQTAGATLGTGVVESGSAADASSAALSAPLALSESGTAADTQSAGAVLSAVLAEAAAAADAPSAGLSASLTQAEAGTATDVQTSALTAPLTLTESGAAVDAQTTGAVLASTLAESGTAADNTSNALAAPLAMAESGAAADTPAANATQAVSQAEAAAATEVQALSAQGMAGITEAGAAQDLMDSNKSTAQAMAEAAAALDTQSISLSTILSVVEAGSALDTAAASVLQSLTLAEAAAALDAAAAGAIRVLSLADLANATDAASAQLYAALSVAEVSAAQETLVYLNTSLIIFIVGNDKVWRLQSLARTTHLDALPRETRITPLQRHAQVQEA